MKHVPLHYALAATLILGVSGYKEEMRTSQQAASQMELDSAQKGREGLPHAQGRVFHTLDDYLAHLLKIGMQDRPFYEHAGAGRYRLNVGRNGRGKPPRYFTREELMRKYGFSE